MAHILGHNGQLPERRNRRKMRKLVIRASAIVLAIIMVMLPCSTVFAASSNENFDDGGYYIKQEIIIESKNRTVQTYNKVSTVYNNSDKIQCSLKLSATFDYGNGTVRCTSAWTTKNIYNDSWSIENVQCSYSSAAVSKASASASFRFVKRFIGIVIKSKNDSLVLTCDKNGIPG